MSEGTFYPVECEHGYDTCPVCDAGKFGRPLYVVSGRVSTYYEGKGATLAEAIAAWKAKAGRGYPDGYDIMEGEENTEGGAILGACETCGGPIIEDDDYLSDEDGIIWHRECD